MKVRTSIKATFLSRLQHFFTTKRHGHRGSSRHFANRFRPSLETIEDRIQPTAPVALPAISAITLQLPGLQGNPAQSFAATSVRGGETYSVGAETRFDAFALILSAGAGSGFLNEAAAEGRAFPDAQISVFGAGGQPYVAFGLTDVIISSFQLVGGLRNSALQTKLDLSFSQLTGRGPGAAQSLPAPGPGQPLSDITLSLQGLQPVPSDLHLGSVDARETFQVGQEPSFAFQAIMPTDRTTPLVSRAVLDGASFPTGMLTLFTGNEIPAVACELSDVLLTSIALQNSNRPEIQFDFLSSSVTRS
jgi:type VI protein secretion system component Hcp